VLITVLSEWMMFVVPVFLFLNLPGAGLFRMLVLGFSIEPD
jgi:hypothetical protein